MDVVVINLSGYFISILSVILWWVESTGFQTQCLRKFIVYFYLFIISLVLNFDILGLSSS